MGEEVIPPHPTLGSGRASWALLAGSRAEPVSPGRKWFYCNLISADRLCWQQVTANSSPFRPDPCTPQTKTLGYRYYYAYAVHPKKWPELRLNHQKCVSLVQGVQNQLEHHEHHEHVTPLKSPMPCDEHRPNPDQVTWWIQQEQLKNLKKASCEHHWTQYFNICR